MNRKGNFLQLTVSLFILTACADLHKDNVVIEKIKNNSRLLNDSIFTMASIEGEKLLPVDTIVLNVLKKSNLFKTGYASCPTCEFWIYYYGYFANNEKYLSVLFAKATMTDAGDEELILAHINKNGHLIDAIPVAEYTSPAECTITEKSNIKSKELYISYKESCAILTDGNNVGESIDSMITIYTITNSGHFKFKAQSSGKVKRFD